MERINKIKKLDKKAMAEAKARWNRIAKPLNSLGRFEEIICKIAGMTGNVDVHLEKKCAVVMCADHGVVEEGISQSESDVTYIVAKAMADGDGNINNLCRTYHADVFVADAGMAADFDETYQKKKNVITIKRNNASGNIARECAMSHDECQSVISSAIDIVRNLKNQGYQMIATGEMGIGNTTPSSAIAAVILDRSVKEVTGRGAGLPDTLLEHKKAVIQKAIDFHQPDRDDPMEILCKLGGYDLAGMTGLFLGGAIYQVPIVIDGFISLTAAAIAKMISEDAVGMMIPSHISKEPAAKWLMDYLGLEPVLHADLCLGEGTGAVMMFPLLDGVLHIYHSVHSFENLEIRQYEEF